MILIALAALVCLQTPPSAGQNPVPTAVPKDSPVVPPALQPGALPADASPEARALWLSLVLALRPKSNGPTAADITAFELQLLTKVISITEDGSKQSNDVRLRFRYFSPSYVSRTELESKVESMRGPAGDWLWDPQKNDRVALLGKDFEQDRRELSQTLSMARNYLALAEPGRLRIAKLERLSAPPQALPAIDPADSRQVKFSALPRSASLEWISVTSPDFQVVQTVKSSEPPMFQAQIGLDPKTHLPLLAIIFQDEHGTMVPQTAVLVDLTTADNYKIFDEHLLPTFFFVHDPLLPSSPFTFQSEARVAVSVLAGSTLRPKLTPDDFRPPKP